MNVLFISIDSLNRHFLKAYGQPIELAVQMPNLDRFAKRAATFDTHYAGSLPCMPARREYFAGIQEFLWRPWGPMEPFDTSVALAARRSGTITQLITDHFHLFQHGSHGYFEDYHGFEFIRGHEYDAWKTAPKDPDPVMLKQSLADDPQGLQFMNRVAYARNVAGIQREEDFFAPQVFTAIADWLEANQTHDQWYLAVDSFDVHEPFHGPEKYIALYSDENPHDPDLVTWPYYGRINEGQSKLSDRQVAFVRALFAAKITMVDHWFGRVLDKLDELNLWDKTMVIVTADHGHYLGDHGWMGKPNAPMYNTLTHTPLFVWHPESPMMGQRIGALTAAVDLYATKLEALGRSPVRDVHSRSLMPLLRGDTHASSRLGHLWLLGLDRQRDRRSPYLSGSLPRRYAGRVLLYDDDQSPRLVSTACVCPKTPRPGASCPTRMRPSGANEAMAYTRHQQPLLFDVQNDPGQERNLAGQGQAVEAEMRDLLVCALRKLEAPQNVLTLLGVE